jgi:hypothetical protein
MPFEILLLFGAIAGVVALFTRNRNQELNRTWMKVAQKLDISLRPAAFGTKPLLSGFVDGHDLTVDIDKKRRGKNNRAYTRFRLGMQPLGLGLKLKSEGFFDGIGKAFGAKDIQVGDPLFDHAVMVRGKDEAVMREYLSPKRRRVIQHFLSSFSGAVITDDEILFSSKGYLRNADEMLGTIDAMLLLAQSLAEVRDDPEAELEVAPLDQTKPTPEEMEADAQDESAAADLTAPAGSPAVAEFCEALFAPGTLSFDTTRTFKESYQGKRVVWSGTLESASPYTVDFDFGSTGGVKAVLTVDPNRSGEKGMREIRAIIGLPPGTDGLENRIGQRVTFAGTLSKVEGFARKVVLSDAELAR